MKLILKVVLVNIAVFLVISSFTAIAEAQDLPIGGIKPPPGAILRLLSMDVPQRLDPSADVETWTTIKFDSEHQPAIRRACFTFSGNGPSCVDVQAKDVTYGLQRFFRVPIHIPMGTKRIECYAEYILDGETTRTNTVTYHVIVMKRLNE